MHAACRLSRLQLKRVGPWIPNRGQAGSRVVQPVVVGRAARGSVTGAVSLQRRPE